MGELFSQYNVLGAFGITIVLTVLSALGALVIGTVACSYSSMSEARRTLSSTFLIMVLASFSCSRTAFRLS